MIQPVWRTKIITYIIELISSKICLFCFKRKINLDYIFNLMIFVMVVVRLFKDWQINFNRKLHADTLLRAGAVKNSVLRTELEVHRLKLFRLFYFLTNEKGGVGVVDIQSEEYKLGQNIRKYRLAKGWSQMDLSNAVDIDRADISKYENGSKGEMGFKTLKKFASALDVTVDRLLSDEEEIPAIDSTYSLLTDTNKEFIDKMVSALLLQQNMTA